MMIDNTNGYIVKDLLKYLTHTIIYANQLV